MVRLLIGQFCLISVSMMDWGLDQCQHDGLGEMRGWEGEMRGWEGERGLKGERVGR